MCASVYARALVRAGRRTCVLERTEAGRASAASTRGAVCVRCMCVRVQGVVSRGGGGPEARRGEGAGENERSGLPAEMPPTQKGASAERAVPAPATTPQKHARDGLRCCLRPSLLLTWLSTPVTRRSSVAMPRLPPRLPPRLLLRPVASSPSRSPSPFSSPPPLDSARRPPTGDALAAPPIPVAPATFIKTISSPAPPSFSSPPPS